MSDSKIDFKTAVVRHVDDYEDLLFERPARLFMRDVSWLERGFGTTQLLVHRVTKAARLVIMSDATGQVCADHKITDDLELQKKPGCGRSWTYKTTEKASGVQRDFAIRFTNPVDAASFKTTFESLKRVRAASLSIDDDHRSVGGESIPSYDGPRDAAGFEVTGKSQLWAKPHIPTEAEQHGQQNHVTEWLVDVPGYAPHNSEAFRPVDQSVARPRVVERSHAAVEPSRGGLGDDVHPLGALPVGIGTLPEREADGPSSMMSAGKTPSGGRSSLPADIKTPPVHQGNGLQDYPNGQPSEAEGSVTTDAHSFVSAAATRTDVDGVRRPLESDVTKYKQNATSTRDSQSRRLPLTKVMHVVGLSAGIALVLLLYHRPWRSA